MTGDTRPGTGLPGIQPVRRPGEFIFATVGRVPKGLSPIVTVCEPEGTTVVVDRASADRYGVAYDFVAAMITLRVHSSLQDVGLTAAVAGALASEGISCNVVAGRFHDHLFVPADRAEEALGLLEGVAWKP